MKTRVPHGGIAISSTDWLASASTGDAAASPLFPPLEPQSAAQQVQEVLHRSPVLRGHDRHPWTLATLKHTLDGMGHISVGAICKHLPRFKVSYKRGRAHVHAPDLLYDEKVAASAKALQAVRESEGPQVLLYEDAFTACLRPVVSKSDRLRSEGAQKATGATGATVRLAACVNALTRQVVWRRRSSYNVKEMYRFFYFVNKPYPEAEVIDLALDTWPVHFHAFVTAHLAKMKPANRIRFLPLPTYAPWTNPTEKDWRKVVREWLSFHPSAGDKQQFIQHLDGWLSRPCQPSQPLLHELGL